MILDLQKFITTERPFWNELEGMLRRLELEKGLEQGRLSIDAVRRLHYLYERASAGLARVHTFAAEPETRSYLENLVARAYGEIHETRDQQHRFSALAWFFQTLPATFRRRVRAFWLSVAVTLAGVLFGGLAVVLDPDAKITILPDMFANHAADPAERVAREEKRPNRANAGQLGTFSAQLMVNNIGVSLKALALGMTWGIGTVLILFYNGILLGLIVVDYVGAGQSVFLLGWLLPHGVIEVPAVLIAGQAGLVLAGALIGWGERATLRGRLRAITPDLTTLILGVALMLIWAGLVEAFFSQYHEPVLPYGVKIAFGSVELALLTGFLGWCGRTKTTLPPSTHR